MININLIQARVTKGHSMSQWAVKVSFRSYDSLNFLKQYIRDCFIKGTTIYNSNDSNYKNVDGKRRFKILTPTWFEHAAFWSGVRRATVAPRSHKNLIGRTILINYQIAFINVWAESSVSSQTVGTRTAPVVRRLIDVVTIDSLKRKLSWINVF